MALLDVCGYRDGDRSAGPFGTRGTVMDRSSHFSFGMKTAEFAVPVGVDVSTSQVYDIIIGDVN